VNERNWSVALPMPIDGLRGEPFVARLAETMRRGRSPG